jgi:beta-mannosidase
LIARNRLFEGFWKDLAWPAAEVGVRVEGGRAVFSCEAFAVGVCLDLDGERALADNFFDVYPGMDYAIDWSDDAPPAIVRVGNLAPSGG